jgi:hypothetical protein
MKKILLVALGAALTGSALTSFAQSPSPAPSDSPAAAPSAAAPALSSATELTEEEKATLQNATEKAQQDPSVLASIDAMRKAMKDARAAMVAKDPSIAPLLDKIEAGAAPGSQPPRLTAEEFTELGAARKAIVGTPEAAAWKMATAEYRANVQKAMIAADPAVGPILEKIAALKMQADMARASNAASPAASASATPGQ